MEINVTATKLKLVRKSNLNKGEFNINSCDFNFSEEYEDLVKMAVFSNTKAAYKVVISNNTCTIPIEVLEETGVFELGVYGYSLTEINGEEVLEKRYSPTPIQIVVNYGSYKANANNSETPTASEYEQYVELLNEGLVEVNKINIDASKSGNVATITITNKDGITKEVQIVDGINGQDGADGKDGKDGAQGEQGLPGKDGKDGVNGQDGHTPVKGVDYWTAADKTEIVNDVLAQIQDSEEVEY